MFSELPTTIQYDIVRNKLDKHDLGSLTLTDLNQLNAMSKEELWDAYLTWHGFIHYATMLHEVHEFIFGGTN